MPKIKVNKETAKVLDKLNKLHKKTAEGRLELKMVELDEPKTIFELAKILKKSKADTFKPLAKLIKGGIVSVSLTPAKKFLKD